MIDTYSNSLIKKITKDLKGTNFQIESRPTKVCWKNGEDATDIDCYIWHSQQRIYPPHKINLRLARSGRKFRNQISLTNCFNFEFAKKDKTYIEQNPIGNFRKSVMGIICYIKNGKYVLSSRELKSGLIHATNCVEVKKLLNSKSPKDKVSVGFPDDILKALLNACYLVLLKAEEGVKDPDRVSALPFFVSEQYVGHDLIPYVVDFDDLKEYFGKSVLDLKIAQDKDIQIDPHARFTVIGLNSEKLPQTIYYFCNNIEKEIVNRMIYN